jgi:hypothetical protein
MGAVRATMAGKRGGQSANRSRPAAPPRGLEAPTLRNNVIMHRNSEHDQASEPVGIIISRGARGTTEGTPRFCAYIWGPAPEIDVDVSSSKVAA